MAGFLRRPESKNDIVKRFIGMQCRLHGNENDDTIVRDLAYLETKARSAVDSAVIDVLKEIAAKCIASCELNRWADRKNPCVFAYNLAAWPARRSRNLWAEALDLKCSSLLPLVSPDQEKLKVNVQLTVLNVNYAKLKEDDDLLDKFKGVIQKVLAAELEFGQVPEDVQVQIWAGSVLYITISLPEGASAQDLQCRTSSAVGSSARMNSALEKAFSDAGSGLEVARTSGGEVHVGEIRRAPHVVSDRSEAIFKVIAHGAWLEQNTRDWDGAQAGTITGTAWGYKSSMEEDKGIVDTYSAWMGFDG